MSSLIFGGARLGDAKEMLFYSPGFRSRSSEVERQPGQGTVKIAADCRLGEHAMRLRHRQRLSANLQDLLGRRLAGGRGEGAQ